jgi:hypothetical protein
MSDLFINIPIEETSDFTKSPLMLKNKNKQITHQIINLIKLVFSQNYFPFPHKVNQPEKGVATGSSISNTIAKISCNTLRINK